MKTVFALMVLTLMLTPGIIPAQVQCDTVSKGALKDYILNADPARDTATVYPIFAATLKPEFPGGFKAFARYMNNHLNFTQGMADTLPRHKIYARILIDRNGKAGLLAISGNGNKILAHQLSAALENLPYFTPGETKRGKSDFEAILIFEFTTDARAASLKRPYVIPVFPTDNPAYKGLLD